MNKTIRIKETLVKDIVVDIPEGCDLADAEMYVDEACGSGLINLNEKDFDERFVSIVNTDPDTLQNAERFVIEEDGTVYANDFLFLARNKKRKYFNFPDNLLYTANTLISDKGTVCAKTTGHDFDYIAVVINENDYPVTISPRESSECEFEEFVVPSNDWVGLADENGYLTVEALYNDDYVMVRADEEEGDRNESCS